MKKLIARARTKTDQILLGKQRAGGRRAGQEISGREPNPPGISGGGKGGRGGAKLACYRGEPFAWAWLANEGHPAFMGHILMGEMIAPF